jgi:hypothetical protein
MVLLLMAQLRWLSRTGAIGVPMKTTALSALRGIQASHPSSCIRSQPLTRAPRSTRLQRLENHSLANLGTNLCLLPCRLLRTRLFGADSEHVQDPTLVPVLTSRFRQLTDFSKLAMSREQLAVQPAVQPAGCPCSTSTRSFFQIRGCRSTCSQP